MRIPAAALSLAGLLLALPAAHARLGESEAQIAARYGAPVKKLSAMGPKDTCASYVFRGFKVIVTFLDGACHNEGFSKMDGSDITAAEIDSILAANAPLDRWKPQSAARPGGKSWSARSDSRELMAEYAAGSRPSVQVGTLQFITYLSALVEQKAKAGVPGL